MYTSYTLVTAGLLSLAAGMAEKFSILKMRPSYLVWRKLRDDK